MFPARIILIAKRIQYDNKTTPINVDSKRNLSSFGFHFAPKTSGHDVNRRTGLS